jgi:RNA polymerase sigma-70 factor, ECF subfamily
MASQPTTLLDLFSASDETLARAAAHDVYAFTELYNRHFQRIYRYHLVRTGNVDEAQDLTAQTFLAALEGIAGFRSAGPFGAWLAGIASRKAAQHFRSRRPETGLEQAVEISDPADSPEQQTTRRLQLAQVSHALRRISPERAEAIVLCIYSELTASEAGRVLGKSEGAVKMLLMRGIKDLRQRLMLKSQEQS